jgi:YVTN family beta-propeller protein
MIGRVTTASSPARDPRQRSFRIAVIAASVLAATVGSLALATRDSGEKETTRGVTATLRVRGQPGSVVAGDGALWVALADARAPIRDRPLLRLDLASGAEQRNIPLGGQASYLMHADARLIASVQHVGGAGSGPSLIVALDWRTGRALVRRQFAGAIGPLALDGTDIWALQVRPAALLRLDARTLTQKDAPLALSRGRGLGLAVGAGYVWVTAADAGEVLRIDPSTRAITRLHVGGSPVGITFAGGAVWYSDRERGIVGRIEPRGLRPVGDPIDVGAEPSRLEAAGSLLFVGHGTRGTVTRIDLRTGRKVGPPIRFAPPAKAVPGVAMAPSGTSVWVSSFASNTLSRISSTAGGAPSPPAAVSRGPETPKGAAALPRGAKVVARIAVPPGGGAFVVGEGAVWAMSDATSTMVRIDPERNAVVARIDVAPGGAAAAGAGAVWLSHPADDTISRIDPRTNKVSATIHVGPRPEGVAVSRNAVWVANADGPSVARIDPATNHVVATIRVGPSAACCAEHMGLIAAHGVVWVAVPNANRLVRIDPATNTVTATVRLPYPPCGFLAAGDARTIWSAGGGCADLVARIDARTKSVTAKLAEPHPVGLALAFGTVWVAVLGSTNVDRLDPRTGRLVARLRVGGVPVRLGVGFGSVWVNDDGNAVVRIRPR